VRSWTDLDDFQAFLDAGGMVEPTDDMPDEYRQEVFRFIEFHANSELMGGLTERDWIPKAPGLRLKQVFLAKTQDEIGHAHLLYMVAADMGIKDREEMLDDLFSGRTRFHNVFHYRAETWADQIAIAYLVDAAAFASQRAVFAKCSYGPYKRILKRIVAEEGFHMRHGEEMLLRLAEGTDVQRRMFQEALERWWWPAVQLFGPDSDPDDPLLRWYIKSERNEDLRHAFVQKYVPLLHSYGFEVPDPDLRYDEASGQWVMGEIDWAPLIATMRGGGPDSRRRIETAARNHTDTAWVRQALDRAAARRAAVAA
jgi:ring-1,2-phenylacetyl-CoA epoxidase subunit PaaA